MLQACQFVLASRRRRFGCRRPQISSKQARMPCPHCLAWRPSGRVGVERATHSPIISYAQSPTISCPCADGGACLQPNAYALCRRDSRAPSVIVYPPLLHDRQVRILSGRSSGLDTSSIGWCCLIEAWHLSKGNVREACDCGCGVCVFVGSGTRAGTDIGMLLGFRNSYDGGCGVSMGGVKNDGEIIAGREEHGWRCIAVLQSERGWGSRTRA